MRHLHDLPAVALPPPARDGSVSLEVAIHSRRSGRTFSQAALTLSEVSQLLWAGQGITHPEGYRTVASAGAIYPLTLYLMVGRVGGLEAGVYQYVPRAHQLSEVLLGDAWSKLWSTVLADRHVKESAAVLAVTASLDRITSKYGERAERFTHIEVGHVVQNVYLQAAAMGLATVEVGSFNDSEVAAILGCSESETPMIMMPLGRRQ